MNYANRGMTFETYIEYVNTRYRASGIAIIEKQNTKFIPIRNYKGKVTNCKVEEKATVDYIGRYLNVPIAIEAKHTSSNRISFSEVKDHQATFLDDFTSNRLGFGAVLVSFNMERFFLVPWSFWKRGRDLWKSSRGKKDTVHAYKMEWTTTGKASVSADELLPEWECKNQTLLHQGTIMAYLSNVDAYLNK